MWFFIMLDNAFLANENACCLIISLFVSLFICKNIYLSVRTLPFAAFMHIVDGRCAHNDDAANDRKHAECFAVKRRDKQGV